MQSSREGLVVVAFDDDDPLQEKFPGGDRNRDRDWRDTDGALAEKFYDSLPVGTKFVFGCGLFPGELVMLRGRLPRYLVRRGGCVRLAAEVEAP